MTNRFGRLFFSMSILLLGGLVATASKAQDPQPTAAVVEIADVELGFSGSYKLGSWTPATVLLKSRGPLRDAVVEIILPDGDGVPSRTTLEPNATAAEGGLRFSGEVRVGRSTGEVLVTVKERASGRQIARLARRLGDQDHFRPAMKPDEYLFLTIGLNAHVQKTVAKRRLLRSLSAEVVAIEDAEQLSQNRWIAYEGVDAILVCPGTKAAVEMLPAETVGALLDWVENGGQLVLVAGSSPEQTFAAGGLWTRILPGTFDRAVPLRDSGALEMFASASDALDVVAADSQFVLQVARLKQIRGKILAHEGSRPEELPLVIDATAGFGRVLFVAFDLNDKVFHDWSGTPKLVTELLFWGDVPPEPERSETLGVVTHAGYDDLAGQLRSALDQFDAQGVRMTPFWLIAAIVFGYILLIAPGDYFLVKRLLRRMELTWISFPVLVLLVCLGAWFLAREMKGRTLRLNQIDLVDIDADASRLRGTTWFTIFSPNTRTYDLLLKASPREDPQRAILSWFGLPGTAIGGMRSEVVAAQFDRPYSFGPRRENMQGVPVQVWATKSFVARWTAPADCGLFHDLSAETAGVDRRPTGTLENQLAVALEDCVLFYDRWAYPLGTIEPAQEVSITLDTNPLSLKHYLTRQEANRFSYDEYNLSVRRIMETMMFYEAAGGKDYVRLANRFQSFVDQSGQIEKGRAVLIGYATQHAAKVYDGDKPLADRDASHGTIYRFLFSVRGRDAS